MKLLQRIVVTNDDGIDAPGLAVAETIAETLAEQVWTIAPVADQSGVGQGVSMHDPLRATRLGARRYALTGTPADCVMYAMAAFCADTPPDLVISGVNWGGNLSDSVMYSGTVGAVLAADHLGLPAIGLSQAFNERRRVNFAATRAYAISVIETLWAHRQALGCCWNVNFPMQPPEAIRGLRFTRQTGGAIRGPRLIDGTDGRGLAYHWLAFERDTTAVVDPDSDVVALRECYVSATALRGSRCDQGRFERASANGDVELMPAVQEDS